ncbi:hypothetical protein GJAV_G00014930 [Gymnothorax javanicus]|nr:hypothetical protein GJAV_G00014930 [Gymnothorax javanicus]
MPSECITVSAVPTLRKVLHPLPSVLLRNGYPGAVRRSSRSHLGIPAYCRAGVSITTDMWRSHQNYEYMVTTMHWANFEDGKFQRHQALASLEKFEEAATSSNIMARIKSVYDHWLPENQIPLFSVSDNGANIKRCLIYATKRDHEGRWESWGWVPCIAHTINLVTKKGLGSQRAVVDMVAALRTLSSRIANSQPVQRRFSQLLELHYPEAQHVKITRDVETRWNSTLTMLESIQRQRDTVEALANDSVVRSFQDFQRPATFQHWWEVMDMIPKIVMALRPCHEATLMASSDSSSLGLFIPMVKGLQKQLKQLESSGDSLGV